MKKSRAELTALRIAKSITPSPALHAFKKGGMAHNPSKIMRLHPAMSIPGVHIRTAEAGEPIFRGGE